MNKKYIELHSSTELKILEYIPFIRTDDDLVFAVDWFITLGIGFAKHALQKNPKLNLSDLIMLTTTSNQDFTN